MSDKEESKTLLQEPAVQLYGFLCLTGMGVTTLLMLSRAVTMPAMLLCMIFFFVGVLGIITRLPAAPLLLLFIFAIAEWHYQYALQGGFGWQGFGSYFALDASHVLLCFAFLAYTIGQYRLQALTRFVFPPDRRMLAETPPKKGKLSPLRFLHIKRSGGQVGPVELGLALLVLPVSTILAEICWYLLTQRWEIIGLHPMVSRGIIWFWVLIAGILIVSAVLGHWRNMSMTEDEATLYLQDLLWQQTRREQRRINRWLAWGQIRQRQKEDKK